ncbi:hypothetical protein [Paractinoplanes brasiliensis]|uniref:hypothetical protein n=1 Tax=Paractinoplanes brasiliensis TaxID=52695 RepID=UPI00106122E0|nr:hypothetical protein [Actinoplanes brasiliensis]
MAEALVAGLAAALGIHLTQAALQKLRERGICPERWLHDRSYLVPFRRERVPARTSTDHRSDDELAPADSR